MIRMINEVQSLNQMLGITKEGTFNGCELAITLDQAVPNSFLYKTADFIKAYALRKPLLLDTFGNDEVWANTFYIHGKIGVVDRDVFLELFDHNELRDYKTYKNQSPYNDHFGEAKWNIDENEVFFPYPNFDKLARTLSSEIQQFLVRNFNNKYIEENLNKRDY